MAMKEKGNSFLFVMMIAILASSLVIIFNKQFEYEDQSIRRTKKSLVKNNLDSRLKITLGNTANCSCQLDSNINIPNAALLRINTTSLPIPEVNLQELRHGCDFLTPDNIIAKVGLTLPDETHRVTINEIKLSDIQGDILGTQFTAKLLMNYTLQNTIQDAYVTNINLVIDPASPVNQRRIASCVLSSAVGMNSGIKSCPVGFTMIGFPNEPSTYCIGTLQRLPSDYYDAVAYCGNLNTGGMGTARLCTRWELHNACVNGAGLSGISDGGEGSEKILGPTQEADLVLGAGNCWARTMVSVSSTRSYRCCLK